VHSAEDSAAIAHRIDTAIPGGTDATQSDVTAAGFRYPLIILQIENPAASAHRVGTGVLGA